MAELKFKILADLSKLKKDLKETLEKKFKIDVSGGGASGGGASGGGKEQKKQTKGIFKTFGLLAIIGGIISGLTPITEFIKLLFSLAGLFFLLIAKRIKNLIDISKEKFSLFIERIKGVIEFLKNLPSKIWNFLKELPGKIWEFLKELPGRIWEKLKEGFNFIKEKLASGFQFLKDLLQKGWKLLKDGFKKAVDWAKKIWGLFKEKLKILADKLKSLAGRIWDKIKQGFEFIRTKLQQGWELLKSLPGRIWNALKSGFDNIKRAVAELINKINPFSSGKTSSVGDAILRPNGEVIKTDPADTLIATKTPDSLGGGGNTFVFNGVTSQEMIDVLKRELGTGQLQSSRF